MSNKGQYWGGGASHLCKPCAQGIVLVRWFICALISSHKTGSGDVLWCEIFGYDSELERIYPWEVDDFPDCTGP